MADSNQNAARPAPAAGPPQGKPASKAPPVSAMVIGPSGLTTQSGIKLPDGLRLAMARVPREGGTPQRSEAQPASIIASTTATVADQPAGSSLAEEIFLSPRVVDERSFDEFASTLRGLVSQAQSQSAALVSSTGEVKALGDELRGASKELWTRVEAAAKVVPGIDQRVAKAEKILATVNQDLTARLEQYREIAAGSLDEAALTEKARASARATIEHLARTELEPRARAAAGSLDAAAEAARAQLDAGTRSLQTQHESAVAAIQALHASALKALQEREAEMIARIDRHAEARGRASQALLDDALARIEAAGAEKAAELERRAAALSALLERVAPAEVSVLAAIDRIEAGAEAARRHHASIEAESQSVTTSLGAAIAEAQRRAEAMEVQLRSQLEVHTQTAAALEVRATALDRAFEPVRQASAIIERAEQAEAVLSGLEARAAEHRQQAEKALGDTHAISAQADQARGQLARSIIEGARSIDSMEARITTLVELIRGHTPDIDALREATAIAAQASQAREQLAAAIVEGTASIDALEARIVEAVAVSREQVDLAAAARLTESVEKAVQIGNALAQLSGRAENLAQRLGR